MKKIIISVTAITVALCLTGCGTRATPNNKVNTISVTELSETVDKPSYFPVSVTTMEEDGEKLLVKNYEVPADVNPYDLVEESFSRGKYQYEVRDILRKKSEPKVETKLASTQIVVNSTSKDMNMILKQAPVIVEYDKDGYRGQLLMNTNNLYTESIGAKSYSYTVTDTKTYTGLARNDTSYIDKSINKNGKELTLVNIDWQTTGTNLVGSTLVPSSYDAVAYYSGTAYGSKSTGYATTITYIGEVSKEVESNSIVSIVYSGERIYNLIGLWIALGVLGAIGATCGVVLLVRRVTNKRENTDNREIAKDRTKEAIVMDNTGIDLEKRAKKEKVQVYIQQDEGGGDHEEKT